MSKVPEAPKFFDHDPNQQDFADWEYEVEAEHVMEYMKLKLLLKEISRIVIPP